MIWRILTSFFVVECLLALSIALVWQANNITPHVVTLGTPVLSFLSSCNRDLANFTIEIPHIASVGSVQYAVLEGFWLTNPLVALINAFIVPINSLIAFTNVLIDAINYVIKVLEFCIIVLGKFVLLRDELAGVV